MSYQAGRPENVLRRAEDLIAIDQADTALQNLYTFITAKRTKHIEPANPQLLEIFKLFISLAVKNRLSKDIKDALFQYKKMIQGSTSIADYENLEQLTKYFLNVANSKLDEAQSKANVAAEVAIEENVASAAAAQKVIDTLEDEADDENEGFTFNISPENILLSSVTTDDSTDRSNKEFFLPWLKFVWDSYRTILELLKNNNKLENAYCQVILQAFQFCIKYDRKSEFKRLCELLKTHLLSMTKPDYEDSVNLSNPDTLQTFLDTRFQQLNTAVKLELWKESFKSIEDVHGLMKLSKRAPKPISLVNYYNNLAKIFQVSNNYIYATASRQKLFELLIQSPVITDAELKENATLYLLTSLSIPLLESLNHTFSVQNALVDADFYRRKNNKLSSLLNLNEIPSRDSLLSSSTLSLVLKYADSRIVQLFNLLEKSFNPLTFHSSVNSILNEIANEDKFAAYIKPLKEVIISKIISKVSTLYDSIKLDFFLKLATFENPEFNYDEFTFEDLLINAKYNGLIKCDVEVDDEAGVINFNDNLYVTPKSQVNSRLYDLEKALSSAISFINVEKYKASQKDLNDRIFKAANENFASEKENILHTAELIKEREQLLKETKKDEQLANEKAKAEEALRLKRAEEQRIQNDTEKREKERLEKTMKKIQLDSKKKLVKEINDGGVIHIKFEDVKDMSEDEIRMLRFQKLDEENQKLQNQIDAIVKRADYIERAQRQYEIPLLQKEIDSEVNKQRDEYDALKAKNLEQARQAHDNALKIKKRLSQFVSAYEDYSIQLDQLSKEADDARAAKAKAAFEAAKKARIEEYIEQKKREFLENVKREQEAAQARAAEQKAEEEAAEEAAEAAKAREEAAKAREEAAKAREEAAKARMEAADPDRAVYNELKNKASLSMSEKLKLRRLEAKYK
jgi:translation initiation factor 3 subunit A